MVATEIVEEPHQGRVLVVLNPAGGEGDVTRTGRIANLAIADAWVGETGPGFAVNADVDSGFQHREDALIAHVPHLDVGRVTWRSKFADDDVLQIGSRIAPAQQERFIPEIAPVNYFGGGQRMFRRQGNDDPPGP